MAAAGGALAPARPACRPRAAPAGPAARAGSAARPRAAGRRAAGGAVAAGGPRRPAATASAEAVAAFAERYVDPGPMSRRRRCSTRPPDQDRFAGANVLRGHRARRRTCWTPAS